MSTPPPRDAALDPGLVFVDELSRTVSAAPPATWRAAERILGAAPSAAAGRYARLVGAEGGRPFSVAAADPPHRLVVTGRHHFARYALVLLVEEVRPGQTALRAQTWAAFPGPRGRLYRTAVIGSRGHVVVVRLVLRRIARRAERDAG